MEYFAWMGYYFAVILAFVGIGYGLEIVFRAIP